MVRNYLKNKKGQDKAPKGTDTANSTEARTIMSWEGFKKAINRAGNSVLIKNVDKTHDKEYEQEERRYRVLEKAGKELQKEAKGYLDSLRAVTASQVTIAEVISDLYDDAKASSASASNVGNYYLQCVKDFDSETVKQLDGPFRETVLDPISKFATYFEEIENAIKKREHKKQDYDAAKSKVRRLIDKPAKDASKLASSLGEGVGLCQRNLRQFERPVENRASSVGLPKSTILRPQFRGACQDSTKILYRRLHKIGSDSAVSRPTVT